MGSAAMGDLGGSGLSPPTPLMCASDPAPVLHGCVRADTRGVSPWWGGRGGRGGDVEFRDARGRGGGGGRGGRAVEDRRPAHLPQSRTGGRGLGKVMGEGGRGPPPPPPPQPSTGCRQQPPEAPIQRRSETLWCFFGDDAFVTPQTPLHMGLGIPIHALRLALVAHTLADISPLAPARAFPPLSPHAVSPNAWKGRHIVARHIALAKATPCVAPRSWSGREQVIASATMGLRGRRNTRAATNAKRVSDRPSAPTGVRGGAGDTLGSVAVHREPSPPLPPHSCHSPRRSPTPPASTPSHSPRPHSPALAPLCTCADR